MSATAPAAENNPAVGIGFILVGMVCISLNDMLIKQLSGAYALHQMVFVRSTIGLCFSLVLVHIEGGFRILRTANPGLHAIRVALVVVANMMFFAAFAVLPLADATALFFVAPLFITLLSIPILGERVGIRRLGAVAFGFGGVLVMVLPESGIAGTAAHPAILALPIVAALAYAAMQVMTRRLGVSAKASAMAVYIQTGFLATGLLFGIVAGNGGYAKGLTDPSLIFLLRAWTWPQGTDTWLFLALGVNSAAIGYAMSRAYKATDAALVAPFEYVALPLAILWGWLLWSEVPGPATLAGIAMVTGAGIYVFVRERKKKTVPGTPALRRSWHR